MFEDFENDAASAAEDRKRMRRSMFASGGVLLGLVALGATMAVSTGIVRPREPEVEVHFDEMPMEEEPPPPPTEPPPPRPRSSRPAAAVVQSVVAPTTIPNEVPQESDEALAEAGDTAAISGDMGEAGTEGGDPNGSGAAAPIPEDEEAVLARIAQYQHSDIELPRRIGGCERPEYPQEARTRGLSDRVVVRVRIREDGSIARVDFVSGDEIFRAAVRTCVEAMQFQPARLSDGTAVLYARTLTFPFRLTNL